MNATDAPGSDWYLVAKQFAAHYFNEEFQHVPQIPLTCRMELLVKLGESLAAGCSVEPPQLQLGVDSLLDEAYQCVLEFNLGTRPAIPGYYGPCLDAATPTPSPSPSVGACTYPAEYWSNHQELWIDQYRWWSTCSSGDFYVTYPLVMTATDGPGSDYYKIAKEHVANKINEYVQRVPEAPNACRMELLVTVGLALQANCTVNPPQLKLGVDPLLDEGYQCLLDYNTGATPLFTGYNGPCPM
eukprot:CAMPEP_0184332564 /NCGR_PEP_ID=MMETSP1089-20130417/1729_1 /TAXON_ID=38269 ORGANISM="Gloeochaete wittrockiana, Strain SAG46.84" /NCGR_SAMPLE_ID=MMETSP1089 /ASSEMBLY_ACC=CAM_ASM_000445 /LENGTH=241 /DNA_ID=CAMNT_0026655993 /DNA_START=34 /DNA_END=759 /DNA_ORIENTATION=+